MDPAQYQLQRNELQRQINNKLSRISTINSSIQSVNNEISWRQSEINQNDRQITRCWDNCRRKEGEIAEHIAVRDRIDSGNNDFIEAIADKKTITTQIGEYGSTVSFAIAYSNMMTDLLGGSAYSTAAANITDARLIITTKISSLEDQVSDLKQQVRNLEQRNNELRQQVSNYNRSISELINERAILNNQIAVLRNELRRLDLAQA